MMLSEKDFAAWCSALKLSETAQKTVAKVRASEPVRRVGNGNRSVCGRYPSLKMGKTIQFESHKVELPAIESYENDEDVLEFYDQPFRLKLSFTNVKGHRVRCQHVPDFLVLRRKSVRFEEWKAEKQLVKLEEKQANHYCQDEKGNWHNPPAEVGAAQYGISYCLRVDSEINWIEYRNNQFLKSYRDGSYPISNEVKSTLIGQVSSSPGISLHQLLQGLGTATADDIYALIATGRVYIDLTAVALTDPRRVQLFRNREMAEAYHLTCPWQSIEGQEEASKSAMAHPGIGCAPFLQASPNALKIANERYLLLKPDLTGAERIGVASVSERTLRRWKRQFKQAEHQYGWGYVGLLPHHSAQGNREPRLSQQTKELMEQVIEEHYETLQQKSKMTVYGILQREWEKVADTTPCPSHVTFYKYLANRDPDKQTRKRQGLRAAYQHSNFYWELKQTTPTHGERPFELCHIDHTELDIELVCSRTGENLGRPWASVLLDAFSRRVLAVYLSFEKPSYRACMMVLRICVQRFERFPETLVVDRGTEFNSVYFETLLATFNCTKKQRPGAQPRFGSIVERFFGTTNTEFLHTLRGNTQLTKTVRQVTRKTAPKTHAVWDLGELYTYLCEYTYNVYEQLPHPALGLSPRATFTASASQTGYRPHQRVIDDATFRVLTLPSTAKGSATVRKGKGIRVNYLNYWAMDDSFLSPEVEGCQVPVRYDPFDVSTAYAYVKGRWVRCISQYHALFQERSEQEIKVISAELRRQNHQHNRALPIRAKTIASYLESAEANEALQLQRLKDLAARDVNQQLHSPASTQTDGDLPPGASSPRALTMAKLDPSTIEPYSNEELWT